MSNCPDLLLANGETELGEEEKELLDIYHHSFNDENIDIDLLMNLLIDVHTTQDKGMYWSLIIISVGIVMFI